MCYTDEAQTKAAIKYAQHKSFDAAIIKKLQLKLETLSYTPFYHVSGFAHPKILVFTDAEPLEPKLFHWGLIPSWTKDEEGAKKIVNQTLNARAETIFEKPAFRSSAKNKRCLVYLDAFYEHHHLNGKTFPFRIAMKDDSPMAMAGLWEEWANPMGSGELIQTFTIVTTKGNAMMKKIHNNPKLEGPRMPVILPKEKQDEWLDPAANQMQLESLLKPFDETLLEYRTVGKLLGKDAIGNKPEAEHKVKYQEIDWA